MDKRTAWGLGGGFIFSEIQVASSVSRGWIGWVRRYSDIPSPAQTTPFLGDGPFKQWRRARFYFSHLGHLEEGNSVHGHWSRIGRVG